MKSYIFRVVVEEDVLENGGRAYHASCPALKGCHTWGHTYGEALTSEALGGGASPLRDQSLTLAELSAHLLNSAAWGRASKDATLARAKGEAENQ